MQLEYNAGFFKSEHKKVMLFCLQWCAFWLLCVITHGFFIHSPKVLAFSTSTGFSVSYFVVISLATIGFFKIHEKYDLTVQNLAQIKWIALSFLFFILINPVVNMYLPLKPELEEYLLGIHFYFPFFYYSSSTIKVVDIIFQQILIYAFFKNAKKMSSDKNFTIRTFSFCFFALHLPLIFIFKWTAFAFIVPCVFAGFIFSYLQLDYKKSGLVWSFCIHELFYITIGLAFRLAYL